MLKKTIPEQIQEWIDRLGVGPVEAHTIVSELTREQQMRCWYAARDMRVQCYMWPLVDIKDTLLPPTFRYGTASEVSLRMMDALKEIG